MEQLQSGQNKHPHRTPTLQPDELTLHLIASGLITLTQRTVTGAPVSYPYPAALQRGLDRLAIACLRQSVSLPQGIPDLLMWSRRPLSTWPLQLPADLIGPADRLLDGDTPTSICDAWACANPDVEAELSERQLIFSAFEVCQSAGDRAAYVAFRTLLIRRPVLTALELQQQCIDPTLNLLAEQIRAAYDAAPIAWAVQGMYTCCPICENLLQPTSDRQLYCENDRCRRQPKSQLGRQIPVHEEVVWLKRGLRRFIAAPGRAELRLAERLRQLGLTVELWPAFDRYDLRIRFANGVAWAIDVKDWANPFLLARQVEAFPIEPEWSRAYFVFPDERATERRDYVRAFSNACPHLNAQVKAVFERDLLKAAHIYQQEVS